MKIATALRPVLVVSVCLLAANAIAGSDGPAVGLDDLANRIGAENVPTGAGIIVGQIEAYESAQNYLPDPNNAEFAGKTFVQESGNTGVSGHATTVGRDFYGNTDSIAPGISTIHAYYAGDWAQNDYLGANFPSSTPPVFPPANLRIFNNSWIASFGSASVDQTALRRADFGVNRDQIMIINGVNNGGPHLPLMAFMYNGLSVGRQDGGHAAGDTTIDGAGRMKPEIVAPGGATSWATAVVSAAAAMMLETVQGLPIAGGGDIERTEVIKAALLAGAVHRGSWTNNPETGDNRGVTDRPLDNVFGADVVNVNNSHLILTGGEAVGVPFVPSDCSNTTGWSLPAVPQLQSVYYRFGVPTEAAEVSILATWNRTVVAPFTNPMLADVDLILWQVNGAGELTTLVGDPGLPIFDAGNVVSESGVDNIEHLYIKGLQAGDYVLEVKRVDSTGAATWDVAVAWLFPEAPQGIAGDVNLDGVVDVADLVEVIVNWGPCCCRADLNGDSVVDVSDLIETIVNWG